VVNHTVEGRLTEPTPGSPGRGIRASAATPKMGRVMRRGLAVTMLAVAAFVGVPAAASADPADPVVYFSFDDGMYYPQGANVTFGFACVSPQSAIVSCQASQPMGSQLDTFHAGTHNVTVTATDYEGRQTIATQTYTVIDITKPQII